MEQYLVNAVALVGWEAMKDGLKLTTRKLRAALKGWILKEDECERITAIVNETPEAYRKNSTLLAGYLESREDFCEVISDAKMEMSNNLIQSHSGSGDNVGRDKNDYGSTSPVS